ncbi:pyridoxamine 5'-phosphate oxidase family protein [Saccharibacillus sp. CPCC 101409]|uniref:pyridoxamine 5'-phosphate oxidase family protein n=1 Tax=Saccharibacillus sp. CPCC 101409 TaxID=3058041 RepID=UPI0026714D81|nr:pyridoxamine 5'-phosphate oxidase family protein [Saccharibacillus sp. CPCC 101409]MDO3409192.1 pyridoxamine 5'-phosphate oxidase family protein [Saccharibacillus sp. CPCC 101409]
MSEAVTQMTESLFTQLQGETFVLLATVDAETNGPTSTAVSWIYAVNPSTLRFAVDHRSRLVRNMMCNPKVTITIFGGEKVYAVNGTARVAQDPLKDVPFKMCCFDVEVEAVRNALFYGAHLSSAPEYTRMLDRDAADLLDSRVMSAMKKA